MAAAWLRRRWPRLLLALGIGATGLMVMRQLSSQRQAREPAPPPAPITTVTALGRLEPIGEVRTIAAPSSFGGQPTLLELRVEEEIGWKEARSWRCSNYPRLQAAVADAEARLRLSETRLEIARADHRNNVKSQEAKVRSLQAQLRTAEADYRRNQLLFSEGALSETDRDARQLSRDTAAAALQEAEAELTRQRATTSDSAGRAGGGVSLGCGRRHRSGGRGPGHPETGPGGQGRGPGERARRRQGAERVEPGRRDPRRQWHRADRRHRPHACGGRGVRK